MGRSATRDATQDVFCDMDAVRGGGLLILRGDTSAGADTGSKAIDARANLRRGYREESVRNHGIMVGSRPFSNKSRLPSSH